MHRTSHCTNPRQWQCMLEASHCTNLWAVTAYVQTSHWTSPKVLTSVTSWSKKKIELICFSNCLSTKLVCKCELKVQVWLKLKNWIWFWRKIVWLWKELIKIVSYSKKDTINSSIQYYMYKKNQRIFFKFNFNLVFDPMLQFSVETAMVQRQGKKRRRSCPG